jgi:hypothetical protein
LEGVALKAWAEEAEQQQQQQQHEEEGDPAEPPSPPPPLSPPSSPSLYEKLSYASNVFVWTCFIIFAVFVCIGLLLPQQPAPPQPAAGVELMEENIHRAAFKGNLQVMRSLLDYAPRQVALWRRPALRRALLNARVQEDIRIGGVRLKGCTPVMLAAWRGHSTMVKCLAHEGADMEMQDDLGRTAAHWACMGRHAPALDLLLVAGASVNPRNNMGRTPLMVAVEKDAIECVVLLLARGGEEVELDVADTLGNNALHLALHARCCESVQQLVAAGASPIIRNGTNEAPLDVARALANDHSVDILEGTLDDAEHARFLVRLRAVVDGLGDIQAAEKGAQEKGLPQQSVMRRRMAAAPCYLNQRVAVGLVLPALQLNPLAGVGGGRGRCCGTCWGWRAGRAARAC